MQNDTPILNSFAIHNMKRKTIIHLPKKKKKTIIHFVQQVETAEMLMYCIGWFFGGYT